MGRVKAWWMDQIEAVYEKYEAGNIDRYTAATELFKLNAPDVDESLDAIDERNA